MYSQVYSKYFRVTSFIAISSDTCIGELSLALLICYAEGYSEIRGGTSGNCPPVMDHWGDCFVNCLLRKLLLCSSTVMLKDMEWKVTSPTLLCLSLGTEQRAGGGPCQWRENDSSLVGKQLFPLSTRQSWVLKPTSLVKQLPFASSGYIDDIHRYNTDHLNKVITDLFF